MTLSEKLNNRSHRRFNILTGEWVLVSPHRTKRPWTGRQETVKATSRPKYDANCYLCPGNERAGGIQNPDYKDVFVFENDFPALSGSAGNETYLEGLLQAKPETGRCKVICFSPDHSLTLAGMETEAIERVIRIWQDEFRTLAEYPDINYVQIFENKGELMGCSNPHPHGQIWAQHSIPTLVVKESEQQKAYFDKNGKDLLSDYLKQELNEESRIVYRNAHFIVLVPFWATWPYEVLVLPRRQQQNILEMNDEEIASYADAMRTICRAYDNLFAVSFPYSAGIHQAPTNGRDYPEWHWHMHFYPPLLRSATVKKFMVGYEMLGEPQRDFTPEYAAEVLRSQLKR